MTPLVGGIPNIRCLQLAVAALPGFQRAIQVAEACDQWLNTQQAIQPVDPELEPSASGRVDDEWVTAVRAHAVAVADAEQRRNIVVHQKQSAANEANSIVDHQADLVIGVLARELTVLLAHVAQIIPKLAGAHTAEQAVAADAGAAWKQLTELADQYQELRAAQTWLMMRGPQQVWRSCTPDLPSAETHANLCFLKNLETLWPDWRKGAPTTQRVWLGEGAQPPLRHEPWPTDSGPELLVWLINSPAEAWIPTARQLRELWDERRNPNDKQPDDDEHDSRMVGPSYVRQQRRRRPSADYYERRAKPIARVDRQPELAETGAPE